MTKKKTHSIRQNIDGVVWYMNDTVTSRVAAHVLCDYYVQV